MPTRRFNISNVVWPVDLDFNTGTVFDLDWLREGIIVAQPSEEQEFINLLLKSRDLKLELLEKLHVSSSQTRRAYEKQFHVKYFGGNYSYLRKSEYEAWLVRGAPCYEWLEMLAQLKRTGHLLTAKDLAMDMCSAEERSGKFKQLEHRTGFVFREAAIVLRKLGELDEEIALLERAAAIYTKRRPFDDRLNKAKDLKDKLMHHESSE